MSCRLPYHNTVEIEPLIEFLTFVLGIVLSSVFGSLLGVLEVK